MLENFEKVLLFVANKVMAILLVRQHLIAGRLTANGPIFLIIKLEFVYKNLNICN
jgi:hypothetical protein